MRAFYESVWHALPEDPEPWAYRRRRALMLAAVTPGMRVLDLGCGAGRFTAALRAAGAEATGVDIAQAAIDRAARNVPGSDFRLVAADGTLPLAHGAVDLVWCSEVLEHVADTGALLVEARRVLKRDGTLLVTVPDHGCAKRTLIALTDHDAHYDPLGQHLRFFTRRSLERTLVATGFVPGSIRRVGGPPLWRSLLVARAERA